MPKQVTGLDSEITINHDNTWRVGIEEGCRDRHSDIRFKTLQDGVCKAGWERDFHIASKHVMGVYSVLVLPQPGRMRTPRTAD